VRLKLFMLVLGVAVPLTAAAQNVARPLVTDPIDETKRIELHGNVHPLAQAQYDQGAVADTFPANRLLLLLSRPSERQTALEQFLESVHRRGSPNYHQWLTPEEFGNRFGPAESDIQAAADWLRSHGFRVTRVTKSKQFLEFSGTAGQLRDAFRTEIHQYSVKGEIHYANSREISIPEALGQLVAGVAPLNDFRAQSYLKPGGEARYSLSTRRAIPDWTIPNPFGTSNPFAFLIAPEDLATQYDITPLYNAGINGSGQTIGIINESNIDVSLVSAYQQLFNLPPNPTQVIIDGDDPGTLPGVDTEAYLDVEVSGALAPMSTVNLYISNGSDLADPIALAAIRAVEDNQAAVLSVSFGQCESELGSAGNQFWSGLWAQAAAQGQTAFVATGDSGSVCNESIPNEVSGFASTPWNVAVGGTDFFYADYATGGASAPTFWNQTNDANLGSLKAPLTEQVWNDGFGLDIISDGLARGEIFAGGSGPSNCISVSAATNMCLGGYPKPSWQSGPGVPNDQARDIPDVSLYASNGANLSAYAICAFEGECTPGSANDVNVFLTGGTSASTPAMAGIMALVVQKNGRQGQANFTFYPLAQQKPSAFHDITLGNNFVLCSPGPADCVKNANGIFVTNVYSAGPGYDLASGLGSVDGNVLVNSWDSIAFKPSTTTLKLSSASITHGTPVTVTTTVAAASGSGTPTGNVAILTNSPSPSSQSQASIPLIEGAGSSSINFFPGGFYAVTANYQGDGIFGESVSSPVALRVSPENSTVTLSVMSGPTSILNNGSVQYNAPLALSIQPVGVNSPKGSCDGNATGTATFTIDGTNATVALNSAGVASWNPPALSIGNHTASATYSGDASFNASSTGPFMFSVTKGLPATTISIDAPQSPINRTLFLVNVGGSLTVAAGVGPSNGILSSGLSSPPGTAAPTGTVTICLGQNPGLFSACMNPNYSQTVPIAPPNGINAQYPSAAVTFPNLAAGQYVPSFTYSGDAIWQSVQVVDLDFVNVGPPSALPTTSTSLSIAPATISGLQTATITTTVTGSGNLGIAPTGFVVFTDNANFLTFDFLTPAKTGATSSAIFAFNASAFLNSGANQITAIYEGDANYQGSTSNPVNITATQIVGDFTLAPQLPQISLAAGSSANVGINLASLSNFNGMVSLTCAPSSSAITCGVTPSMAPLNGIATAMLQITASPQAAARRSQSVGFVAWPGTGSGLALAFVLLARLAIRKRRLAVLAGASAAVAVLLIASCGGSGGSSQVEQPPPNPTAYSVLVTGTANGIVHNAKVIVVVP